MTIITKVGVSYDDQMNDDVSEVDSFSRECYQALFSPPFLRREPGDEARGAACVCSHQYCPGMVRVFWDL